MPKRGDRSVATLRGSRSTTRTKGLDFQMDWGTSDRPKVPGLIGRMPTLPTPFSFISHSFTWRGNWDSHQLGSLPQSHTQG